MTTASTFLDASQKAKATRLSFGEELAIAGEKNPRVVALDADLSKSTRTDLFAAKFPDRFFNMGIAEANLIGTAAGLANSGMIPYAASFGCFLTGRYDQIRMSVSFTGANVRLVGTHSGVGIGEDGHSQMALEDLTLMRSLPNMTVFQPADDHDTRRFINWSLEHVGPCYLRLTRQNLPALKRLDSVTFKPGHWDLLSPLQGGAVVLLASGGLMQPTLAAVEILSQKLSNPIVLVNANWIQPIDESLLLKIVESKPSLVVTLEDHYKVGGLGGAVAEFMTGLNVSSPRLLRIGVEGFGQSGTPEDNYRHYGFTGEAIASRVVGALRV